ncbi:type I-F CRISPR-associated endonuclease Cas1f [Pseudobacteriovorax antillogorgiicola]|uniref:CRISPR-associated endonuclease Cas1 n=1 Tax=Pseudobacteriovorax antillogorgiicola TaxID=1513793 RepID=A0A1Y6C402_9BACT|nr:type I-F CRISPR-associated endonuclease Cas1f [Pseudobacteriovorax antillogorgiicola]TCS49879.1 CRISPR-associated Cas1 family protein [Pseudobacteriovorax antillogorgiicola]SMF44386.1 CRISPR-associated protein, Cas1 family [Pseudobacteriovorax antillogorgiicola]
MESLTDLKAILHSKRANIFYIEHCKVLQKDGRVLYLSHKNRTNNYWNIPIANTTVILLGNGTSITQAAVRMLASAGVVIGFTGGGGTPLLMGTEVEWLVPHGEYRPTEYLQGWMSFWFEESKRLKAAKYFQRSRLEFIELVWSKDKDLLDKGFDAEDYDMESALDRYGKKFNRANSISQLLGVEGELTSFLYRYSREKTELEDFKRDHKSTDPQNTFLSHGNYLAYGLAATSLWVLGIPYGFAVMHGKTRKGALVFDIADLVKDAIILPQAFISAKQGDSEQEFRSTCIMKLTDHKALDYMFNCIKKVSRMEI